MRVDAMTIRLNTLENAKAFCAICESKAYCGIDIDLMCGRYVVDAKSIMGILSMDLTKVMKVVFHGDKSQKEEFNNRIEQWKVEQKVW